MRILVVSTPIFRLCSPGGTPGYAGLEVIAWHTALGLAKRKHQVWLVAPDGSECPGVNVIHCGPEMRTDEKTAHDRIWKHYIQLHPECIIDHSWNKWSYQLKIEGRIPCPILGVFHAPIPTMMQAPPPLEKACVVCISEDQKSHYEGLFGQGRARRAYNGIDMGYYKSLNIPRTDRFLFLARFSTIKGPDIAIKACKEAGVGLDLVGDTQITQEPEYLAALKREADGKQIRFVGPATRAECVWHYSQAKCLLHPVARFREPLGLAPIEALACGTPCLSWDNGAMRETVGTLPESGDFWLVRSEREFTDKIKVVAEMPISEGARKQYREHAGKFSVEAMAERYESLAIEAVRTGGW
jgi:glycosyltransferase involved in cell wall biosynthesis